MSEHLSVYCHYNLPYSVEWRVEEFTVRVSTPV